MFECIRSLVVLVVANLLQIDNILLMGLDGSNLKSLTGHGGHKHGMGTFLAGGAAAVAASYGSHHMPHHGYGSHGYGYHSHHHHHGKLKHYKFKRAKIIAEKNVVAERPKHPQKKRQAATNASGFHHPKKLRGDYEASNVAAICVSATPEHESDAPADLITGLNICTIGASERFVIYFDSFCHSSTRASEVEGDSIIKSAIVSPVITEAVVTSHDVNVPSVPKMAVKIRKMDYHNCFTEFNVGTARQAYLNAEVRIRTDYCLSERKRLESECEKQADLLKISASEAAKKMHVSEIDALKQKSVALKNKKGTLDVKVAELLSSISSNELELKELNAIVSSLMFQKYGLLGQVHELESMCFGLRGQVSGYERLKEQIEESQDAQMNIVNDKVAKLDADLLEMTLHLEEKFYPHLLNTISGQRWLLTYGLKLGVVKCLNSQEYLSALGATISRAIKKGMQDGLSVGIDNGKAGRSLKDVAAYNPSAEADYTFALQRLREVDFPLLVEQKSHKDASIADVIDLLRLEGPLADAPVMSDLQPNIEQLKLPIHHPKDQVILGETSLLDALYVTHSRVERIRENIVAQRSALIGVSTPLVDLLSVENLVGAASTSDSMVVTAATTTAMSDTFAFASTVPPITIKDYEIMGTDGSEDAQGSGQGKVASFPNTVEFEKEELDTPLKHNPPS
nr:hypothetical protein [Tanacetum cinerariifolium]